MFQGSINKKKSKKKGLRYDTMALPPITTFATGMQLLLNLNE